MSDAFPAVSGDLSPELKPHPTPVPYRLCVGCRERAERHSLLRLVVIATADEPAGSRLVEPDIRARRPGRGAWIHPRTECLELAQRRRAFARAFRLDGPFDLTAVQHHLDHPGR